MILTNEQEMIRDMVRDFAQGELRPKAAQFEADQSYPASLFEQLGSLGLMGMTAPETYGGAGSDFVSYVLALIELAAGDGALSTIVSIQNSIMVGGVLKDGTEAQKARWLGPLIRGEVIGAFALTEADAGTDAAAIRTRAEKTRNGWRLNGAKQFITSGQIAKLAMVIAVTDPAAGKNGMTAFLVPTDTDGYGVDKVEHKLGQAASDTCALRFDDMMLPDDAVLGGVGRGYRTALSNLETGRIGIAAQCIGMAQAALDIAIAYAKERTSFGHKIIEHQAVGFRLADMATRLEAARHLVLHAAALKDAGRPCLTEACMAKLAASEAVENICSGAIQTLGGYGYLEDYGLAKLYRDQRVCQIYEGTSDVQRMIIGRAL